MYIRTQNQYSKFTTDELSELLGQTTFQINNFGLWTSDHDNQASYISNDIEIVIIKKVVHVLSLGINLINVHQEVFLFLNLFN